MSMMATFEIDGVSYRHPIEHPISFMDIQRKVIAYVAWLMGQYPEDVDAPMCCEHGCGQVQVYNESMDEYETVGFFSLDASDYRELLTSWRN